MRLRSVVEPDYIKLQKQKVSMRPFTQQHQLFQRPKLQKSIPQATYTINVLKPPDKLYPDYQQSLLLDQFRRRRIDYAEQSKNNGFMHSQPQSTSQSSTHPILVTQLQQKVEQLRNAQMTIEALQKRNRQTSNQLYDLRDVVRSFYTKGVPSQQARQKQIFDGSYPTLIQQADAMRKALAQSKQQIRRLEQEKGKSSQQVKQREWRLNWHGIRIRNLQYQLSQAYKKINSHQLDFERKAKVQQQNLLLRQKIMQYQTVNNKMHNQNNKLKNLVQNYVQRQRNQVAIPYQQKSHISPLQKPYIPPSQQQRIPTSQKSNASALQKQFISLSSKQKPQTNIKNTSQKIENMNKNQQIKEQMQQPVYYQIRSPFETKPLTSQQEEVRQLSNRLNILRQENSYLQQEHQYLVNRSKTKVYAQVSFLDQKQRDPYTMSKSVSTNYSLDKSTQAISRLRMPGKIEENQIQKRIQSLRLENNILKNIKK